jgi:hypothetical protein
MSWRALGSIGFAAAGLAGLVAGGFAVALAAQSPSPLPSPAPASPAGAISSPGTESSPSPTPPSSPSPGASLGTGQWDVNGAVVKLGGSLAGSVDASGNTFSLSAAGSRGQWNAKFGAQGNGPITMTGSVTGRGPVIDATVTGFGVPVTIKGTPGKDLSVSVGLSRRSSTNGLDGAQMVALVITRPAVAETPPQVFTRLAIESVRAVIGFTIVGWLLLLIAPGLKGRAHAAITSVPLSRLAVGAILALDIPLASLLVVAIGLPLGLWWLGLLGLLMYLVLAVGGFAYAGYQLGRLCFNRLGWERVSDFAAVPVGLAVLCILGLIPYAGPFLSVVATVYGIGSMLYAPRPLVAAGAATELATRPRPERPAQAGRPVVE